MKVLLISSKYAPEYAGSGLRAHKTYKRLSRKYNIEFEVICNSIEFCHSKCYSFEGVNVTRIYNSPLEKLPGEGNNKITHYSKLITKYYTEIYETFKSLKRRKYDVIHTFGNSPSVAAAAYLSSWLRKPMIIELCNIPIDNPHPYLPVASRFMKANFSNGKVFVAISRQLEKVCNQFGYTKNVWCRPNPINKSLFYLRTDKDKYALRERLTPFKPQDKVLTYVAKFVPRKNHIFLINVISRLPCEYKLVLAGPLVSEGEYKARDMNCAKKIKNKIIELELEKRVHMHIGQVEMSEYLAMSDLFLFPSWNEALGTPMLESLGCGVPVIANVNESAFRQWIVDNKNGFLCELEPDKWVEAIKKTDVFAQAERENIVSDIYRYASEDIIDKYYYKIIKALTFTGQNGEININEVLKCTSNE